MPPIKRKPAVGETAGFQNLERLATKFDAQEDSSDPADLQYASRWLRARYGLPLHIATLTLALTGLGVRP